MIQTKIKIPPKTTILLSDFISFVHSLKLLKIRQLVTRNVFYIYTGRITPMPISQLVVPDGQSMFHYLADRSPYP